MPGIYEKSLKFRQEQLNTSLEELFSEMAQLYRYLRRPHQDDWDDALLVAQHHVHEASLHLNRAVAALREGC